MLHDKFQDQRTSGSGEDDFYHIWAWQQCCSCDQDDFYKIYVPTSQEGPTLNLAFIGQDD